VVTEGWVESFLSHRKAEIHEMVSRSQGNPRLDIPRLFLDMTIECLKQHVLVCCTELIFNSDEVGISEGEDRLPREVIVPTSMSGHTIHHRVHGNFKHISVVCCASPVGEFIT
jgi:hypothetical protein